MARIKNTEVYKFDIVPEASSFLVGSDQGDGRITKSYRIDTIFGLLPSYGYITDAPADGQPYLRQDNGWVQVPPGGGVGNVFSVFGRIGAVTGQVGDYSAFYSQLGHTHTESQITDLKNYLLPTDIGTTVQAWSAALDSVSGVNTGDQTSIVGISGTKLQFNTALTDGSFKFVGDAPTAHTHLEADITDLGAYLESVQISDIVATGTPSATTYLRGDGVWATVTGVTSVFGRSGIVTAQVGDYSSFYAPISHTHTKSQITDFSVNIVDINAVGVPSTSTYLRGDGSWASVASTFSSLSDVSLTSPALGQAVMYNGSFWVNRVLVTDDVSNLSSYTGFDARYYTETEVNSFFSGGTSITGYNKSNWDTAFGWGNHAGQYVDLTSTQTIAGLKTLRDNLTISPVTPTAFRELKIIREDNLGSSRAALLSVSVTGSTIFVNEDNTGGTFGYIGIDGKNGIVEFNDNGTLYEMWHAGNLIPSNYQLLSQKGAANGYAPLNASAQIDSQYLPSFVDDVLEYANQAAFPVTGETGKLYVALDSNFIYRWSGTVYIQVGGSGAAAVDSVFGRVGAITAQVGDYSSFYLGITATATNSLALSGVPLSSSGNRFGVIPQVGSDGVMEAGRYIDFHFTDGDTTDFLTRIEADAANSLKLTGDFTATGTVKAQNVQVLADTFFDSSTRWYVSATDKAAQRADARDEGTTQSKLHWYGLTDTGGTTNARHAFYTGSEYINFTAESGGIAIGGNLDVVDGFVTAQGTGHTWRSILGNSSSARNFLVGGSSTNSTTTLDTYLRIRSIADGDLIFQENGLGHKIYHEGSPSITAPTFTATNGSGFTSSAISSRDKIRVWNSGTYAIGMGSSYTFGGLSDYAMSFQMNNQNNRGFWWGDDGHANSKGAMALTTDGRLTVSNSIRVGFGEDDTTTPVAPIELNGDFRQYNGGAIERYSHAGGYQIGSYNSVSSNGSNTNPIYVIGSSYKPTDTVLSNMYGVGYAEGSQASFLNSTDLGTNPSGWGMYVASDGNARIFLNALNGITYQLGVAYASNFILNSDRRRKSKIDDIKKEEMSVRWRTFELDTEPDVYRVGVIAQELEETHPEFVESDSEGNLTVKYIDLLNAKMAEKDRQLINQEERIQLLEDKLELILKSL